MASRTVWDGCCQLVAAQMAEKSRSLTAVKGIQIVGARTVCYLDTRSALGRVLEQIDIRSLLKPMVGRVLSRGSIEIVYVTEPARERGGQASAESTRASVEKGHDRLLARAARVLFANPAFQAPTMTRLTVSPRSPLLACKPL